MKIKLLPLITLSFTFFVFGADRAWGEAGPPLNTGRIAPACATLDDGRLLLAGGHGSGFVALNSLEVGAPESGTFTQIELSMPFDSGAIARLDDGRYLLAGSADNLGVAPGRATAVIFDPSTDTVVSTGSMSYRRTNCVAATLSDGRVLVVGGWYNADSPRYAELYDPQSGTFNVTGALQTPRSAPQVLPTADGRAVVMGGVPAYGGPVYDSVEIYDPELNSFAILRENLVEGDSGWLVTANFKEAGETRLPDGRYVMLAYKNENPVRYASILFDPTTLVCTVEEIPTEILDGAGIGSGYFALDEGRVYFMLTKMVGSGPSTTVRIGGFDTQTGVSGASVEDAFDLDYTPYYAACAIRGGRFFSAGATSSTGGQSNFGSVVSTFFADLPHVGNPDYRGWYFIDLPWMYYYEGDRWIYLFEDANAYDFVRGEYFMFGGV